MFDPTIYENLKVVVEGEIYDHDLNGEIMITDRQDLVNLAKMSRQYSVSFKVSDDIDTFEAAILLEAQPEDLYGEILENDPKDNGCQLTLNIHGPINDTKDTPAKIQARLEKKWAHRPQIHQEIHFTWGENSTNHYFTKISLSFDRKINEDHIGDLSEIVTLLTESLHLLNEIGKNS